MKRLRAMLLDVLGADVLDRRAYRRFFRDSTRPVLRLHGWLASFTVLLLLILLVVDYLEFRNGGWQRNRAFEWLTWVHAGGLLISVGFAVVVNLPGLSASRNLLRTYLASMMVWAVALALVDQFIFRSLTTLNIVTIAFAVSVPLRLRESLAIFLLPYVGFNLLVWELPQSHEVRFGNLINSVSILSIVLLLSRLLTSVQYAGYLLRERARDLQTDLDLLKRIQAADFETAEKIQKSILPRQIPRIPGIGIHAVYQPIAGVGGDFYDFYGGRDTLGVFIADVAGHGLPAAFITAMVKIAATVSHRNARKPADFLNAINHHLYGKIDTLYLTGGYLSLDFRRKSYRYANGGHAAMMLQNAKGGLEFIKPRGRLIGSFDRAEISDYSGKLRAGDRFFLLTDGLVESEDADGRQFGEKRLIHSIEKTYNLNPDKAAARILADVAAFCGHGRGATDDITLVIIDYEKQTRAVSKKDNGNPSGSLKLTVTPDARGAREAAPKGVPGPRRKKAAARSMKKQAA